jgi:hypothetical protein
MERACLRSTFNWTCLLLLFADKWIAAKMEGYWQWSKNDTRLDLINPWHWSSQPAIDGPDKPRRYARGANEFPPGLRRPRGQGFFFFTPLRIFA